MTGLLINAEEKLLHLDNVEASKNITSPDIEEVMTTDIEPFQRR